MVEVVVLGRGRREGTVIEIVGIEGTRGERRGGSRVFEFKEQDDDVGATCVNKVDGKDKDEDKSLFEISFIGFIISSALTLIFILFKFSIIPIIKSSTSLSVLKKN